MSEPQKRKPDLGGYVQVNERIAEFYAKYPDGRLVTTAVSVSTDPDGKPRVTVEAAAYRTVDDPLPGRGNSWMELPGSTNFTRGSELENTETSAWGRAIGSLGIGITKSIASSDEIRGKERDAIADAAVARQGIVSGPTGWNPAAATYDSGLIGHAEQGKGDADFELRATADGSHVLSFRLTEGRKGLKATATGPLAELIAANRQAIEGQRVTAWGSVDDRTFTPRPKDGETPREVTYQVLTLARLKVGDLDLSEPDRDDGPSEEEREEMADLAFPVTA